MGHALIWDESKRQRNLRKHGLDFAHAAEVLESRYRLDTAVVRGGADGGTHRARGCNARH